MINNILTIKLYAINLTTKFLSSYQNYYEKIVKFTLV